jgi:hypothetical protein
MAVSFGETTVVIDDVCGVEDALPLLEFLQSHRAAHIDMQACTNLHSAVLQVAMAAADRITVLPEEDFLRRWLTPLLHAGLVNAKAECGQ